MEFASNKEILKRNPNTDKRVVEEYEHLALKLKKLGVDPKPRYSLGSPLGDSPTNSNTLKADSTCQIVRK